ncbi:lytic transglycosylase domain-containing protein [Salimicrobium halophilum]|uniref:lytic transglycosylase domain-containing protein n=1 Tax=Salimicrobium halophilum TaxID=86666 RepID=UPI001FDFFCED|nr:lytic transglycosylase domain-containing protein [Salimicrobium halophilum]
MNMTDFRSMIQMQAMSALQGNRQASSFTSGMQQMMFQSVLEASMNNLESAATGPSKSMTPVQAFSHAQAPEIKDVSTPQSSGDIDGIIREASEKFGVSEKLIRSVVQAESSFNPQAVSHAGAQGLMQLMPATAAGLGVEDPMNPKDNVMGGTMYLRDMLNRYDGDEQLALAAYNAGPGNVDKYGGIPPFEETQNYVRKVLNT